MKKLYLIGNLKMNLNQNDLKQYFKELLPIAKKSNYYVGVALPSVYLSLAQKTLKRGVIKYGVQNVHYENSGAFTGELSTHMIKEFGVDFAIIGHSERRAMFNETDESVNKKVLKALSQGITPIICVGETLKERKENATNKVVKKQIIKALEGVAVEQLDKIIFAYEPVWAIGTGISATSKEANAVTKKIKEIVLAKYELPKTDKEKLIVLYGGSLNEKNAGELLNMPDIDGGLIGGASLKVSSFGAIINTVLK